MNNGFDSGIVQDSKSFLGFTERISKEDRCFPVLESLTGEAGDLLFNLIGWREDELWPTERGLHDEDV